MAFNVFTLVGTAVDQATATYVTDISTAVITAITPVVIAAVTLYIVVYGYLVITGRVQDPMRDMFIKGIKIAFIVSIALTAGTYQADVVDIFTDFQNGMAGAIKNGDSSSATVYASVDDFVNKGFTTGSSFFGQGGMFDIEKSIAYAIAGILTYIVTVVLAAFGGGFIILSQVALKLLLGLGPFFVAALLFTPTQKFFDMWAGQVMNYIFATLLCTALLSISAKIFVSYLTQITAATTSGDPMMLAGGLLIVGFVLFVIIRNAPQMAAAIAGGIGLAGMNPLAVALDAARMASHMKNVVNPTVERTNPKTGEKQTQSLLAHRLQGNTSANPAYRAQAMERLKNGFSWGTKPPGGSVKPDTA